MWRLRSTGVAVLAAILAAACGGGGGGSTSVGPAPPAAPTRVQISMANQDTVARAAIASIQPFTSLTAVSVTPSPAAGMAGKASTSAQERSNLMRLTLQAIDFGVVRPAAAGIAHPLATVTSSEPCQLGGSVTATVDDRDNSGTLTAGDALTLSFVQCSDWANQSINGGITFAFSSVAVTPSTMDVTGSMAFQQFVQVDGAASLSMNGGLSFTLLETMEANGIRDYGSYTVSGSGLTVGSSGGALGFTDTFSYREGYAVTVDEFMPNVPGFSNTYAVTASGSFSSGVLGNELALTTPQPFQMIGSDAYPREGQLMISGHADTKLGLTVTSSTQVRMEVCDDGDGVWEGTKMVDWSWLM
jgi:hypothetical protein